MWLTVSIVKHSEHYSLLCQMNHFTWSGKNNCRHKHVLQHCLKHASHCFLSIIKQLKKPYQKDPTTKINWNQVRGLGKDWLIGALGHDKALIGIWGIYLWLTPGASCFSHCKRGSSDHREKGYYQQSDCGCKNWYTQQSQWNRSPVRFHNFDRVVMSETDSLLTKNKTWLGFS